MQLHVQQLMQIGGYIYIIPRCILHLHLAYTKLMQPKFCIKYD